MNFLRIKSHNLELCEDEGQIQDMIGFNERCGTIISLNFRERFGIFSHSKSANFKIISIFNNSMTKNGLGYFSPPLSPTLINLIKGDGHLCEEILSKQ